MGTPERDIMARFIDLRYYAIEHNLTIPTPRESLDPAIAKDYELNRAAAMEFPLLAFQSAKTQEETAEKIVAQCFPFSGIPDPEARPGAYRMAVAMFVTFCDAAIRARSYEIALELQRHPETGQESSSEE